LLKEQAVREAQQAVRGDFLAQLLRLDTELNGVTLERAHLVGYQFDQPHQVLFVIGQPIAGGTVAQLAVQFEKKLRSLSQWGLVVVREHGIAVIVESKSNADGETLAQTLLAEVAGHTQPVVVGIGQVYAHEKSLRRSYDEALEAAEIGQRLGPGPKVSCHWELGLLAWLYRLPREAFQGNPYFDKIHILAGHDGRTSGGLVNTLETYLEYGGALADAAAALNVHRNTLLYRLGRIEEIADLDLKDVKQRLNLYVALKGYRLKE
jgi:purine catabolism regulator